MELAQLAGIILNTAGSIAVQTGEGEIEKYYPILIQIVDTVRDEQTIYYLDDVRAWAGGDFDGIAGKENLIIQSLAQAALSHLERIERDIDWPPPEAKRIECKENEDNG